MRICVGLAPCKTVAALVSRSMVAPARPTPLFERTAEALTRRSGHQELLRLLLGSQTATQLRDSLVSEIEAGKIPPPKRFTYIMRRATKAGAIADANWPHANIALAEEVFRLALRFYGSNNYLWAEIIACCTRSKRTDIAERLYTEWRVMRTEVGMEGGLLPMEAMIAHYAHAKQPSLMATVYEHIREAGLVPSAYSTSALAKSFCAFGEVDKATQLLQRQNPTQESWHLTNHVINALCRNGQLDDAVVQLNDSIKLGFMPTHETYNNLLRAAAQTGQNASLEIIIERMVQAGLPPTQQSWRMVLLGYAFARREHVPSAPSVHDVWRHVQNSAPPHDPRTACAAVLAYLRIRDVNNAMAILKTRVDTQPIEFAVWDRFIELYHDTFRTARGLRRAAGRLDMREGALMKVYWMMRRNFAAFGAQRSKYDSFRWRALHEKPDNIERVFADMLAAGFFDSRESDVVAQRQRLVALVCRALVRDQRFDKCASLLAVDADAVASVINRRFRLIFTDSPEAECVTNFELYMSLELPPALKREGEFVRLLRQRFPEPEADVGAGAQTALEGAVEQVDSADAEAGLVERHN